MPLPRLTRRRFFNILAGAALGTYAYAWRIEPHWVEVVRRDLPIAGLPSTLEGQTLVQLSDLHVGDQVDDDFLLNSFDLVNRLKPAFVTITGDFMTCRGDEQLARTLRVLERLQPGRLGSVAVLGNHDHRPHFRGADVAGHSVAPICAMT